MSRQRDFLEEIGEQFEILTDGYYGIEAAPHDAPLGVLTLKCELNDEVVKIRASAFAAESHVSASAIAVEIAALFDRQPRDHASVWVDLPEQHLEDLQRLTAERVMPYGVDVSRAAEAPPKPLRPHHRWPKRPRE